MPSAGRVPSERDQQLTPDGLRQPRNTLAAPPTLLDVGCIERHHAGVEDQHGRRKFDVACIEIVFSDGLVDAACIEIMLGDGLVNVACIEIVLDDGLVDAARIEFPMTGPMHDAARHFETVRRTILSQR